MPDEVGRGAAERLRRSLHPWQSMLLHATGVILAVGGLALAGWIEHRDTGWTVFESVVVSAAVVVGLLVVILAAGEFNLLRLRPTRFGQVLSGFAQLAFLLTVLSMDADARHADWTQVGAIAMSSGGLLVWLIGKALGAQVLAARDP